MTMRLLFLVLLALLAPSAPADGLPDLGDKRLGAAEPLVTGRIDGLAMQPRIERAIVAIEDEQTLEVDVLGEVVIEVGVGPGRVLARVAAQDARAGAEEGRRS